MIKEIPEGIKKYIKDKPYIIDDIGMSDSVVMSFDNYVLKIEKNSANARSAVVMMRWLEGIIPVPQVIHYEIIDDMSYILMTKINGKMSCDDMYMKDQNETIGVLAEGLKMLWCVDTSACPIDYRLEHELAVVRNRVENKIVPAQAFEGTEFVSNIELLEWLENNKPLYEPVLSHGDYCMPNVFIENRRLSGFIDLGDMGIAENTEISHCAIEV